MKKDIRIKPKKNIFKDFGIENVEVKEILFNEAKRNMTLVCFADSPKKLQTFYKVEVALKNKFGEDLEIEFKVEYSADEISNEDFICIIERAIEQLKVGNAISKAFLFLYRIFIKEQDILIELKNKMAVDTLNSSNINLKLERILKNYGIKDFHIKFVTGDFNEEIKNIEDNIENKFIKLNTKIIEENETNKGKNNVQVEIKSAVPTGKGGFSKKKDIKSPAMPISEFKNLIENEIAVVEGELFSSEIRELKTGKFLLTMRITDMEDSVTAKIFLNTMEDFDVKVGDFIKISGKKQIDTYSDNEETIMVNILNKLDRQKEVKLDNADEKMIELHTHTKLSEMSGVEEVKSIIDRALQYGHKSVAITDYGVVHAFPFAYKAAKNTDLKVIFGCEMFMVDDEQVMVQNPKDVLIEDEIYVVFDLETLGLNSYKNEIIEIGAIKMQGTRIIDKYSQLVNPKKDIPKKIQEITNIDNFMVENQPTIEEVLPKFLEFVGDATLVAHNAPFDIGFIKRDIKKYIGIEYNPTVIDTLQMARDLYPNQKAYGLKPMTKYLKVGLENHHRAVDDSQATAAMFGIFLEQYLEKGITNQKDMTGAFPLNFQKQDVRNVLVLVKDLIGLKNMYKLISDSHIEYFGNKKPRILKSVLEEYREGLIIGAPTSLHFANSGELSELYIRNNKEKLEKHIDFYDYIELQPRVSFSELLDKDETGAISSFEDIEIMNKYFYNLAKEKNKIVTASSNVHYLDKEEHRVRSIILFGSGNVFRENQYMVDNGFYFRTTEELLEEFDYFGEKISKEIVVSGTNEIDSMIEKIQPIPSGFFPPKLDNAENIVREMTYEKAYSLYGNPLPENIEQRLEKELNSIIGNGFSVLYLSAQKLVKKSLDNGYLVGSRGSVGSSLVAYMMGITEVNALYPHYLCGNSECKYSEFMEKEGSGVDLEDKVCPKCGETLIKEGHSIPFEVFMGFDGDKVPDIDLNFSGEYQSEIHKYCEELFGKENVFKAGTISTLAEKNAEGYVKKFFENHSMHPSKAEIIRMAKKCEGVKKTTGQHPGGMIIVPKESSIYNFTPVQRPANDQTSESTTTHFDYHVMDEQLVKLDILGHDDPTTLKLLEEYTGIDVTKIPLADEETLKIFSGTESLGVRENQIGSSVGTYGVPEFGTSFVRQMLMDTKPTTFAELVRISGLSHGTDVWLNNAQEFVREGVANLSQIISVRDDIMNFLIDQGLEKGTAFKIMEFVRKGMPSKNEEQWAKYSELMKEHEVPEWYIESCRRIKYMFPKGHAVAYVTMAMRIAYFKVHYPLEFYAAYLSRKVEDFDFEIMIDLEKTKSTMEELKKEPKLDAKKKGLMAVCEIIVELRARGFEFLNLDIYKSAGNKFTVEDGKIRIPLMGMSGLGASVMENIVKEREVSTFMSYEDLKRRTKTSQTTVDKLKEFKCIDSLDETNQKTLFF